MMLLHTEASDNGSVYKVTKWPKAEKISEWATGFASEEPLSLMACQHRVAKLPLFCGESNRCFARERGRDSHLYSAQYSLGAIFRLPIHNVLCCCQAEEKNQQGTQKRPAFLVSCYSTWTITTMVKNLIPLSCALSLNSCVSDNFWFQPSDTVGTHS